MNTLNVEQLQKLSHENQVFQLINTLDAEHFEATELPGAVNIPVSQDNFVEQVEQQVNGDKSRTVVVYCASEECHSSTEAAKKLEEAGFEKVFDFEAGAKGWKEAGKPQLASN